MSDVAAIYVNETTGYQQLSGVECWPASRDARNYYGPLPVVAHPPCAQWSQLRKFSKPRQAVAKYLAFHALEMAELFGGVIEHPRSSTFWAAAGLPLPGSQNERGCNVLCDLVNFGAPVRKPTGIFVAHCRFEDLPPMPYQLGYPTAVIDTNSRDKYRLPFLPKSQRSVTPPAMCEWLVECAKCSRDALAGKNVLTT